MRTFSSFKLTFCILVLSIIGSIAHCVLYGYLGPADSSTGLEDVIFMRCLKSLGTLPTQHLFTVLHDFDLSSEDDDVSSLFVYFL